MNERKSGVTYAEKHGTQIGAALKPEVSIYHELHEPVDIEQRQIHRLKRLSAHPGKAPPSFAYENQFFKSSATSNSRTGLPSPVKHSLVTPASPLRLTKETIPERRTSYTIRHDPTNPLKTTFLNPNGLPMPKQQPGILPPQMTYINPYSSSQSNNQWNPFQ